MIATCLTRTSVLASLSMAAAALLAACGGSSPASSTASSQSTTVAQVVSSSSAASSGSGHGGKASHGGKLRVRVVSTTGAAAHGSTHSKASTTTTSKQPNPCALVTTAEASSALHVASVTQTEAPLGPTCIFVAKGHTQVAAVSVQVIDLKREIQQMKKVSQTSIAGHKAYCGTLGVSQLLVPLINNEVLNVTAPCAAAQAIAVHALGRVKT